MPTTFQAPPALRRCSSRIREPRGSLTPGVAWHVGGIVFEPASPHSEKLTGTAPRRSFIERELSQGPVMPWRPRSVMVSTCPEEPARGDALPAAAPNATNRPAATSAADTARLRYTRGMVAITP